MQNMIKHSLRTGIHLYRWVAWHVVRMPLIDEPERHGQGEVGRQTKRKAG